MLRVSLQLCSTNLFPNTPSTVYIFTHQDQVDFLKQSLGERLLPNVHVLPIEPASWAVPAAAGDEALWHSAMPVDYRLMGDWRLSYMPDFVRRMGHRFVLQLDDDSYILSPVPRNLVRLFAEQGYQLAARQVRRDPAAVTWGLPELARYFLTTSKIQPATLFQYCEPASIEGLYSSFNSEDLGDLPPADLAALGQLGLRGEGGWNRTILYGNCVMFSLDWWFRPEVNRFVQLCRSSGGSFAFRWNEQGVIAMLWQMFVPPERFLRFEFAYAHRISPEAALRQRGQHG